MKKRICFLVLTALLLAVLVTAVPSAVFAANDAGTLENGVQWDLTDGVLTITGSGAAEAASYPWEAYSAEITSVVADEGITSIGDNAFFFSGI